LITFIAFNTHDISELMYSSIDQFGLATGTSTKTPSSNHVATEIKSNQQCTYRPIYRYFYFGKHFNEVFHVAILREPYYYSQYLIKSDLRPELIGSNSLSVRMLGKAVFRSFFNRLSQPSAHALFCLKRFFVTYHDKNLVAVNICNFTRLCLFSHGQFRPKANPQ